MCLLLFAYDHHPAYRLVLAANRDEFYERPTAPADFWEDQSGLLAGRDLRCGGTWLGITRTGRLSALTNVRDSTRQMPDAPSRGALVARYLRDQDEPEDFLQHLTSKMDRYNGFNLIVGDAEALYYLSNRNGDVRALGPGLYGVSNHLLDTPWPKVERGKAALRERLGSPSVDVEAVFDLLADEVSVPDQALPDTGVGLEWERVLAPAFIRTPSYGTRSSTVLLVDRRGQVTFVERSFAPDEAVPVERRHQFVIESSDAAHAPAAS